MPRMQWEFQLLVRSGLLPRYISSFDTLVSQLSWGDHVIDHPLYSKAGPGLVLVGMVRHVLSFVTTSIIQVAAHASFIHSLL